MNILTHSNNFNAGESLTDKSLKKIESIFNNTAYIKFIKKINGGFFYNYSLQIYAIDTLLEYHNIFKVNDAIREAYGNIIDNEFFFAQEIFGNQFGYSEKGIIFFNAESGEKEVIAKDFNKWLEILTDDLDYFTGQKIVETWNMSNRAIEPNERLYPKKPFVIGGSLKLEIYSHWLSQSVFFLMRILQLKFMGFPMEHPLG